MTRRMSPSRRARIFEVTCTECGFVFDRGYRISKTRAAKNQFCSIACQSAFVRRERTKDLPDLFWPKVAVGHPDECWEWLGHRRQSGYGWFNARGRPTNAHRVAYALAKGPIPDGAFVCHSCDNPPCCNPRHLWLGSPAENTKDMDRKGRRTFSTKIGAENHNAKLNAEVALEIVSSNLSNKALSKKFGVTPSAINNVRKGKAWAHVTGVTK
jgi:hypothetical protein